MNISNMIRSPVGHVRLVHELAQARGRRVAQLACLQQLPEERDPPVLLDWMPCCRADGVPVQCHTSAPVLSSGPPTVNRFHICWGAAT